MTKAKAAKHIRAGALGEVLNEGEVSALASQIAGPRPPRLHPQSWHQLHQLVKLHGVNEILDAVRAIQIEQARRK